MDTTPAAQRELEAGMQYAEMTIGVPELDEFVDQGLITHVHAQLTSGKEGTVYCCRAHPSTRRKFIAAKVCGLCCQTRVLWPGTNGS